MTTLFMTQNSTYEVDTDRKMIRRNTGVNPELIGKDGEWQPYEDWKPAEVGDYCVFRLADGRTIYTSQVKEVLERSWIRYSFV